MRKIGKIFGWIIGVFIVLMIIGSIFDNSNSDSSKSSSKANETTKQATAVNGNKTSESTKKTVEKNNTTEKASAKKVYGIKQDVPVDKLVYRVNKVSVASVLKAAYMDDLKTSGEFIIINVTVTNKDKSARTIDSNLFHLVSSDGTKYEASSDADMYINKNADFFLSQVNPNMNITGNIAFEVPKNAKLKLDVDSGMFGKIDQIINLN